jgi:hypothetical protein
MRFQFVLGGKMAHCTPKKGKLKKPWKAANLMNRRKEISTLSLNSLLTWERKKQTEEFVAKNNVQLQKSCDDFKLFFLKK